MSELCPECGTEYKQLGNHWQFNESHRPEIPDSVKEIIIGNLMGDGCISGSGHFILEMSSEQYVRWVSEQMPEWLVTGISIEHRSTQYGDITMHRLSTRRHPWLVEIRKEWYGDGKKKYPTNIELTPKKLLCWYCGDGTMKYPDDSWRCIAISCNNERHDWKAVENMFSDMPVDPRFNEKNIYFTHQDSMWLWEYMGSASDGFENKWPDHD